MAGLILMFGGPLKVRDKIQIGDLLGEVKTIGFRASTVRTFQGAEVIVPNAMLIADQVINWTMSDQKRRIEIDIGVQYGSDPDHIISLLREIGRAHPNVMKEPPADALFIRHGESSLDFQLLAWVSFDDSATVRSELRIAVNKRLTDEKIGIPYPQRDLNLVSIDAKAADVLRGLPSKPAKTDGTGVQPAPVKEPEPARAKLPEALEQGLQDEWPSKGTSRTKPRLANRNALGCVRNATTGCAPFENAHQPQQVLEPKLEVVGMDFASRGGMDVGDAEPAFPLRIVGDVPPVVRRHRVQRSHDGTTPTAFRASAAGIAEAKAGASEEAVAVEAATTARAAVWGRAMKAAARTTAGVRPTLVGSFGGAGGEPGSAGESGSGGESGGDGGKSGDGGEPAVAPAAPVAVADLQPVQGAAASPEVADLQPVRGAAASPEVADLQVASRTAEVAAPPAAMVVASEVPEAKWVNDPTCRC